jgi:hypothetical protein
MYYITLTLLSTQSLDSFPAHYGAQRLNIRKSSPIVHILSQTNEVHKTPFYLPKIHLDINHPLTFGLPGVLFPSIFPTKMLHSFFFYAIRAVSSANFILLDLNILIILGEKYKSRS